MPYEGVLEHLKAEVNWHLNWRFKKNKTNEKQNTTEQEQKVNILYQHLF